MASSLPRKLRKRPARFVVKRARPLLEPLEDRTLLAANLQAVATAATATSQQRLITPAIKLGTPTLSAPANGAVNLATNPTFAWTAVGGANVYRIVVATSAAALATGSANPVTSPALVVNNYTTKTSFIPAAGVLKGGVTYYWEIRASNTVTGSAGDWSIHKSFTTKVTPLPAPVLSSPAAGATGVSTTPTFTWAPVAGANTYRILVATSTAGLPTGTANPATSSTLIINATSASASFTPAPGLLKSGTTYVWEVSASNTSTGAGGVWSVPRAFITALPATTLTSPANQSTGVWTSPTFSWTAVSGANSYRIVVATSPTALPAGSANPVTSPSIVVNGTTSATTFVPAAGVLRGGTTYYWEVRATNSLNSTSSVWSASSSFSTVVPDLAAPGLLAPQKGVSGLTTTPTFSWSAVTGANTYRILVATSASALPTGNASPATNSGIVINATSTGTSFTPASGLLNGGTVYYWEVSAGNTATGAKGIWSTQSNFATAMIAPVLTSPAAGAKGTSATPTFTWAPATGADSYRILVASLATALPTGTADPTTNPALLINTTTSTPSFTPASGVLASGTNYYWEVRALNSATGVSSAWPAYSTFSTMVAAPVLTSPVDGATGVSTAPAFSWSAVTGANTYRLLISTTLADLPTGTDNPGTSANIVVNTTATSTTFISTSLAPGTTYYWQVRADNTTTGMSGLWSSQHTFSTAQAPLAAPALVGPANAATAQSTTPSFTWAAVAGADTYRILVSSISSALPTGTADPTINSSILVDATTSSTSFTPAASLLKYASTYFWEVRASSKATGAGGYWATRRSFTTGPTPLAAPTPASPANGATGQSTTPMFLWSSVTGANTYRILVATSASLLPSGSDDPTNTLTIDFKTTSTSFTPTSGTLSPGVTYYWEVRAGNTTSGTGGLWSTQRYFTTQPAALPAPTLVSPANAATGQSTTPTLTWTAVAGANIYRILIATTTSVLPSGTADPGTGLTLDVNSTATSYTVPSGMLSGGTTYYWEVRAGNTVTGAGGNWSSKFYFTTQPGTLAAPVLKTPANAATGQSVTPIFTWNSVSGANSYRILVATSTSLLPTGTADPGSGLTIDSTGTGTSYTPASGVLAAATTYYWQVRAGNTSNGAPGYWSSPFSFTTQPAPFAPPTLTAPANGATGQSTTPGFTWSSVSGANSYTILVATSASALPTGTASPGTGLVINSTTTSTSFTPASGTLNAGTTYYWEVRATNTTTGATGTWSSAFSFATAGLSITMGGFIKVAASSKVRTQAGLSSAEITNALYSGGAPAGLLGVVIGGPTSMDGYTWWKIDFGPGQYAGWTQSTGINPITAPFVRGIDVSHYQGTIDWTKASVGLSFVFMKASEGTSYVDPKLSTYMTGAKQQGLIPGVYHFTDGTLVNGDPVAGAQAEAQHFLATARSFIGTGYLPPVLDVEGSILNLSATVINTWVGTFLNYVEQSTGVRPMIYASKSALPFGQSPSQTKLWLAAWRYSGGGGDLNWVPNSSPWPQYTFWQYSSTTTVPGVSSTYTDGDVFYGTLAQLQALAGITSPQALPAATGRVATTRTPVPAPAGTSDPLLTAQLLALAEVSGRDNFALGIPAVGNSVDTSAGTSVQVGSSEASSTGSRSSKDTLSEVILGALLRRKPDSNGLQDLGLE